MSTAEASMTAKPESENNTQSRHNENPSQKKPYSSPKLVHYGSIRTLVQSTGSQNGDGGQNMMV